MTAPSTVTEIARVLRAADLLIEVRGSEDAAVLGASQDSRAVARGDVFLAWAGTAVDAHDFVPQAVSSGATAVLVERALAEVDVPQLVVTDGRAAAARVADHLAGSPWRQMRVIGVTGTNGKTTTTWLLREILAGSGPTASLGTLGLLGPDGERRPGTGALTTPGPVQLSQWMAGLAREGTKTLVMEASSHALEQRRLDGVRFGVACFTNLTQDHLDYHGDLESYADAKRRLATLLAEDGVLVVNADEPAWAGLVGRPEAVTWSARGNEADLMAEGIVSSASGTRFLVSWRGERAPVRLPLIGAFNVENALAAIAAALASGVSLEQAVSRLETVRQIPGRLEVVTDRPFAVLIDFAHTPDALRNVLGTLRQVARGRLIVVFGAGGDRDRGKRAAMGAAVAEFADLAVLTSDNPRTEDPERILDDIEPGLQGVEVVREADRRRAIGIAVERATEGDVVLLAGKGHEAFQIVGAEKHRFDERAIALDALAHRGAA